MSAPEKLTAERLAKIRAAPHEPVMNSYGTKCCMACSSVDCHQWSVSWPCDTALVLAALDEAEAKQCQMAEGARRLIAAARSAMKLPRPWIDGNVTFEEWDAAFQALDEALKASEEGA